MNATPRRLALWLAAALALFLLAGLVNAPVETAARPIACPGVDCLRPTRPSWRHAGFSASDLEAHIALVRAAGAAVTWGLLVDLAATLAIAAALALAATMAASGLPITARTVTLARGLPIAAAVLATIETALLALAHAGAGAALAAAPWASALKFGLAAASALTTLVFAAMRWTPDLKP